MTDLHLKFVKQKVLHISLIHCRFLVEIYKQFLIDLLVIDDLSSDLTYLLYIRCHL